MPGRKRYTATETSEDYYWERVKRNLGWLGNTLEEQKERQLKLWDATIGVAGVGGIGGATAERLVRMGVQNLKVADPDTFEVSNINRQYGASLDTVGRNKAEVVAELVYNTTRDVNVEVYPEGITEETVDEFFEGCDYVLDKIELYEINARYTLHRAFRRSQQCRFMMLTPVFGHRTFFFKWTRDSMPAEEYFGVPADEPMNEKNARRIISRFIPEMPDIRVPRCWRTGSSRTLSARSSRELRPSPRECSPPGSARPSPASTSCRELSRCPSPRGTP
ncbi:ThiF family adenylyltransferase [Streptomyces sp. NPDC018019]|uniref:ThiF family adenylyltransferase n=1 Tax=Streptomyces sp. NPDC018019 TaxID=3365030 RepID=UPI00378DBE1E